MPPKLLQASPHPGLQVQNLAGEWIDAPPIPGTFVVNIGKGQLAWCICLNPRLSADHLLPIALETVTQGLARATSHRVLSPPKGSTPRYSIPFFQNIAQRVSVGEITLQCMPSFVLIILFSHRAVFLASLLLLAVSPDILKLKEQRGAAGTVDCKEIIHCTCPILL